MDKKVHLWIKSASLSILWIKQPNLWKKKNTSPVGRPRACVNILIQVYLSFLTGLNRCIRIKYMGSSCKPTQTVVLAQSAMMYCGLTLLLAAAVLTVMASAADSSKSYAGHARVSVLGGGVTVTRFVFAHCTATCQLSSRCLFLNRAPVRRHIST
jgi:hypothetical protein